MKDTQKHSRSSNSPPKRRPERRSARLSGARAAPTDADLDAGGVQGVYSLIFGDSALDARASAYDRTRRMLKQNPHCAPGVARALSDHLDAAGGGDLR